MMIESVVGMIIAAPKPIPARAAMSSVLVLVAAAIAEQSAKIPRPDIKTSFRPTRSANDPAASRNPAKVRE